MIISKLPINLYGITIIISIIIGILYTYKQLKKEKLDNKFFYLYVLMTITFTIIFGLLFTATVSGKKDLLSAGLSSYGGFIGVIAAAITFEKIISFHGKLIKYAILSLPLVYGIAKIACFIAGCCYGIPYNGPFSVTYTEGLNIPLFPIQITETICFIILFIILNKYKHKKNIIPITIITSATTKMLLDFLRYEHIKKIISVNQIFSFFLIIVGIILWYINNKKIIKQK